MSTVKAIQFDGRNAKDIIELLGKGNTFHNESNGLWIFLPNGQKKVHLDDFVLISDDGTIRLYDSIDFKKDFEPVP